MATIRVGVAQLDVVKSPDSIETQALGSCVGIALYDSYARIGGLSHAMLPSIDAVKESSRGNIAKFVDKAIEELLSKMISLGANKKFITAKLAGGANMFPDVTRDDATAIGRRNIEAAKAKLKELGIRIIAEEVGGSIGRTIILDTTTGKLKIRSITQAQREI